MRKRPQINQIKLSPEQRQELENMTRKGTIKARVFKRAQTLLLCDQGLTDAEIRKRFEISNPTLKRIRKQFVTEGLEAALYDATRLGRPSIFSGETRAKITALACTQAPEGYAKWSVRLLADKAVELGLVESISTFSVHDMLKKTS
jgi:putative transposase